jgi:AcrR family transcriptional regulator
MAASRRPRLTADDWVDAALAAMAEGGLSAVAVEPLAARLGATKGSFYWHFPHRDALVGAALQRWEASRTQDVIAGVEVEPDPAGRLRALLVRVVRSVGRDPIEVRLLGDADHPLATDAVRRVVARRIAYLVEQFEQLGLSSVEARRRAVLLYTAYVGHDQLALRLPGVLEVDDDYVEAVVGLALAGIERVPAPVPGPAPQSPAE